MADSPNKTVHIGFSASDYKKIQEAAKKLGLPVSVYCKMLVMKEINL